MELGPDSHLSEKAQHDYRLVQLAIKGDQKAYADLMDRYRDSIYFLLLKMVNNKDDADDLTIEAFGKAFKNLKPCLFFLFRTEGWNVRFISINIKVTKLIIYLILFKSFPIC